MQTYVVAIIATVALAVGGAILASPSMDSVTAVRSRAPHQPVVDPDPDIEKKLQELVKSGHLGVTAVWPRTVSAKPEVTLYPTVQPDGSISYYTAQQGGGYTGLKVSDDEVITTTSSADWKSLLDANDPAYGFFLAAGSKVPVAVMAVSATGVASYTQALQQWYYDQTGKELPFVVFWGHHDVDHAFDPRDYHPTPTGSGDKMARALQVRFDNQVDQCAGGKAAYHCSGLIMRATGYAHPFTLPSRTIAHGVASFSYVRSDTGSSLSLSKQGIILKGNFEDLQQKTHAACIYPDDADSQTDHERLPERHQCSGSKDAHSSDADPSSCQSTLAVGVDAPAQNWIASFNQKYPAPYMFEKQCSFSTQHAGQFYAAIQLSIHPTNDDPWNEMILSPWSSSDQEPMPGEIIEAIWYLAGDAGAKEAAQKIVQAYSTTYGKTVYAVSVNFESGKIIYEP